MSISLNRVKELFREPCEENQYIAFDDKYGCIVAHLAGNRTKAAVDAQNKILLEYDKAIKEKFGDEHFHGEVGIPLAMPLRMALE